MDSLSPKELPTGRPSCTPAMDQIKDSQTYGNHPAPPSLPSHPFSSRAEQANPKAPILFLGLPSCPVVSGMPKTENLLPRAVPCPLLVKWDSVASHNQTQTVGQVKCVRQSPWSEYQEHQNAGRMWVFSLSHYSPHALCPTHQHRMC